MPTKIIKLHCGRDFYDDSYDSDEDDDDVNIQLNLNKASFCGRREELKQLHEMYEITCGTTTTSTTSGKSQNHHQQTNDRTNVALVTGFSEAGKSTLVRNFIAEIHHSSTKKQCFVICGKFNKRARINKRVNRSHRSTSSSSSNIPLTDIINENNERNHHDNHSNPYAVIVEALTDFALNLCKDHNNRCLLKQLRNNIRKSFDSHAINTLTTIVPAFGKVLLLDEHPHEEEEEDFSSSSNSSISPSIYHFKNIFTRLMRVISTEDHPILFFLDDLQWIDNASLLLIHSLLSNADSHNDDASTDPSSSSKVQHLMFIGTCTSTELIGLNQHEDNNMDNDHPLSKSLASISRVNPIKKIDLLNLSLDEIDDWICGLLDLNTDEAVSLVEAVYDKTRGNISNTIQLMKELETKKRLYFSVISFQWEWNFNIVHTNINNDTRTSSNSIDAMNLSALLIPKEDDKNDDIDTATIDEIVRKIKATPEKLQKALIVAAHTRSKIEIETLHILVQRIIFPKIQLDELTRLLDFAVSEGMLTNVMGSNLYRFPNDQIWKAVHSLLPVGYKKNKLCEKLGLVLLDLWSKGIANTNNHWVLYVAADHLNEINHSNVSNNKYALKMTIVNLEAGERSMKLAAFNSAAEYLQKGIKAIKKIRIYWEHHYELSTRLYRALANVELILGHYETGYKIAKQLFDKVHDVKDALPTYKAVGQALSRQDLHEKSLALYWDALDSIGGEEGCIIKNRNKKSSMNQWLGGTTKVPTLASVSRYFKNNTDEQILNLPIMSDENNLISMCFYNEAGHQAYMCGNWSDYMLITLRKIQITRKHGLSKYTALTFVHFASLISTSTKSSDQKLVFRLGKLARRILEITNAKSVESQTLLYLNLFIEGWGNGIDNCVETIKTLRYARKIGMETGDIEFGFNSWCATIHTGFMVGQSLDALIIECNKLVDQAAQFSIDSVTNINDQMLLTLRYLIKDQHNASIDWKKLNSFGKEHYSHNNNPPLPDSNERYRLMYGYQSRLALAVYFRKFDFVEDWVQLLQRSVTNHESSFDGIILGTFYSGLALCGLSRAASQSKSLYNSSSKDDSSSYISMARKEVNKMKQYVKNRRVMMKGSVNTNSDHDYDDHRFLIMQADLLSSDKNGKINKVKKAFAEAIQASMMSNHKHDAALCNEMAGEYFIGKKKFDLARKCFTRAKILYEEWGAIGKVEHLKESKYGWYLMDGDEAANKSELFELDSNNNIDIKNKNTGNWKNYFDDDLSSSEMIPRTKFRVSCTTLPFTIDDVLHKHFKADEDMLDETKTSVLTYMTQEPQVDGAEAISVY